MKVKYPSEEELKRYDEQREMFAKYDNLKENEVLIIMIAAGLTNEEIAKKLELNVRNVVGRIERLVKKVEAKNRFELITIAYKFYILKKNECYA